jgi:hypothetical protein
MYKTIKILKYFFIFLLIALLTGCASSRNSSYSQKRKKASTINASQLGRNKYYFSIGYQKKMVNSYKKKR